MESLWIPLFMLICLGSSLSFGIRTQTMARSSGKLLSLCTVLLLAACRGAEERPDDVSTRDSAGVRIVESRLPVWQPGEAWRVEETPSVEIGQVEGPNEYLLHQARDATRLFDGRIVVLNAGTNELRFYDPAGQFLGAAGGTGDGPGEFRRAGDLIRSRDTLYVWDNALCRLAWFDSFGAFVASTVLNSYQDDREAAVPLPCNRATLREGGYLLVRSVESGLSEVAASEIHRPPTRHILISADSLRANSLGVFPGIEQQTVDGVPLKLPFSRSTQVTASDDPFRICIGEQKATEVACFDSEMQRRLVRWDAPPERVSTEDVAYWRRHPIEALAIFGDERLEGAMEAATIPEFRPPYSTITLDSQGNLWVRQTIPLGVDPSTQWYEVFDSRGRWLGEVEAPGGEILEIGDDYMLTRHLGGYDVESIRLHQIDKG